MWERMYVIRVIVTSSSSGRSTQTSEQRDSHGKFVVEEELEAGL
jgi:hypothetical protein